MDHCRSRVSGSDLKALPNPHVFGKKTLDPAEEWTAVTDETDLDAAGWRFFKTAVEMK